MQIVMFSVIALKFSVVMIYQLLNVILILFKMKKSKILWWFGLIIAILTAIISYCSCTAGISIGRANKVEQTVTNLVDSTSASFSIIPNK